jgi:hypothetical protein
MDFEVSEEMSVRLTMIEELMQREVIPLEGELLHGDPEALAARVAAARPRSNRRVCGPPTIRSSSGGSVCRWSTMGCSPRPSAAAHSA